MPIAFVPWCGDRAMRHESHLHPGVMGNAAHAYQQQRYRSLAQAWVNWREQRLLTRLLTQCQLVNGTVLDVPCGYGRFASLYVRLGITVIGADRSPQMVHLAAAHLAQPSRGYWLCASILERPFAEDTFDGVR